MSPRETYTIADAAETLGVSRELIKKMIENGKLRCMKYGSGKNTVYRISKPDLEKLYILLGGEMLFRNTDARVDPQGEEISEPSDELTPDQEKLKQVIDKIRPGD